MMDIPVRFCEFCYQVLSIRAFNPVREFFNTEILDFLTYNADDPWGFGAVKTYADSNIRSNDVLHEKIEGISSIHYICMINIILCAFRLIIQVTHLIIIRKFQPSDFQWVIDIERKVFNEHDPYLYMQFYEIYPDTFIVAQINGFVIGYVAGFLAHVGVGRIFSLAVYPTYQNRSVGSNLLNEIKNIFRNKGALEIILEVRMDNIKAKRF